MANLTNSSSSPSPLSLSHISTRLSSAAFEDYYEVACSICLEPFSTDDPATITSCKHEYHLHCILEWSQRSKECPICWRLLTLKDTASQELLNEVEAEKHLRSRSVHSYAYTNYYSSLDRFNNDQVELESDEQLLQRIVADSSRARYIRRPRRQRSLGTIPSEILAFNSFMHASGIQPTVKTSASMGSTPARTVPSAAHNQPPTSNLSSVGTVTTNTSERNMPSKPRVIYSQQSPESARRLKASGMFSKLSAASSRWKESICKNTRSLKEKLIARNASVKELSKGVQREMKAGIAGVARLFERLDLTSKRSSSPAKPPICTGGKSDRECGILVMDTTKNTSSLNYSIVSVGVEIPLSCHQCGHHGVRT